jgi:hypothetical protein
MITADVGVATPLEIMLFDGAVGKGVRVTIRTTAGTLLSTHTLTHIGEGLYTGLWTPPANGYYHANYIVYTTPAFTVIDRSYSRLTETYRVSVPLNPETIAAEVWEVDFDTHNNDNTFGRAIHDILAGTDPDAIAAAVWSQALIDFNTLGSFGWAINTLLAQTAPGSIADEVWDALVADHQIPNTFGDWVRATHEWAMVINNEVYDAIWGLHGIYNHISNRANQTDGYVLINTTKIDAITPTILGSQAAIIGQISINRNLITSLTIQSANETADIIAEIMVAENKIDSIAGLVSTIQNNTTIRFIVPERLIKPVSGTKNYQFHLRLYDAAGNPEAPDSAPTIRVRRLDTGVDIVLGAVMTQDGTKTGAYYYVFTIGSGTADYPALVEATLVENGVTRYVPAVTEISEFESDLNALQAQLAAVGSVVDNSFSQLTNPSYGLSALKVGEGSILTAIAALNIPLTQIKSKTDLIPTNIATTTDINDVLMQLAELPRLPDIATVVNNARDNIKGVGNRDISQVYNLWDISSLAKTSDPRFNYLDAAISSRSVLTAADVWHYGTRSLTYFTLDNASIERIWAYLTSQADDYPHSMGKLIVDMLDENIASRATAAEVMGALTGVAQEDTLNYTRTEILNSLAECKTKLNNLTAKTILIQAKTDRIPVNPAVETTVVTGIVQIREDLAEILMKENQIKEQTDLIPPQPATEGSVHAIPTDPVRVHDPRLSNLDAKISTRSTLSTADLALLALKTDVTSAKNSIISEIDDVDAAVTDLHMLTHQVKAKTDLIPADTATLDALSDAENAILEAIAAIAPGGGATAADIWAYVHRTLTQDPATFGPDISHLATKTDVADATVHQYINKMTTTFSPARGEQEVLVWAEKDGACMPDTSDCTIIVKDALGVTKWTQSSSTANVDGIYRFVNPIVVASDSNYYITMSIKVDGLYRINQQAFITIG